MENIKPIDVVKNSNTVQLIYCRNGIAYYGVIVNEEKYQFPVDLTKEDTQDADFNSTEKALTLMRWIRKSLEVGEFIPTNKF